MPLSVSVRGPVTLDISIIVPFKDEAGNLEPLGQEIAAALEATSYRWECLWVDDGSTDEGLAEVARLSEADERHRCLTLGGHCGQAAALAAGFAHAGGRLFATLDADGQSDPSDLPRLLAHLAANDLDLVNGRRLHRHDRWVRRVASRIANGFRNRLTAEAVRDVGCAVRVMRRETVNGIPCFHGMHRFLPALVRMNGFSRMDELPVRHRPRRHGLSKYGINDRLWVGIGDTLMIRWLQRRSTRAVAARPRVSAASTQAPNPARHASRPAEVES